MPFKYLYLHIYLVFIQVFVIESLNFEPIGDLQCNFYTIQSLNMFNFIFNGHDWLFLKPQCLSVFMSVSSVVESNWIKRHRTFILYILNSIQHRVIIEKDRKMEDEQLGGATH